MRVKAMRPVTLESKSSGNLINTYKYLTSGIYNKHEPRPFFVLLGGGTKGTVHKLEHRRLPLSVRKHFFTVQMTELGTDYPQI